LPAGFTDTPVFTGLSEATVMQFAADGRVYVGEKNGRVYEFDSLTDTTPMLVKDLSTKVYDWGDRGLLGMALDPGFTTGNPYVYVLYTLDAPIGGTPPVYNDSCPNGDSDQWCLAGARLSRFKLKTDGTGGAEQVLIEDWCQQFPSHSIGTLAFGPDGALYVGGGDGASYVQVDYGQLYGNPCADPANEGGALRAQDDRTNGDPTGMNGAILRVDPATGNAEPDNPLVGNGDPTDTSRTACAILIASWSSPVPTASSWATSGGTATRSWTRSGPPATRRSRTSAGRATKASGRSLTIRRRTCRSAPGSTTTPAR
jgi:glucose/arabinose dehydrogenase